jgi:hypothetical protein
MRYYHRTHLSPDEVLAAAQSYFGGRLAPSEETNRRRSFAGAMGKVSVAVKAEGGHYTFVDVTTDQVGEAELDKVAKRFLALVHQKADPSYQVRGAY